MPRTYVIGVLQVFPLSRRAIPQEIYQHLKTALEDTFAEIPFLGGRIVATQGTTGRYEVRGWPSDCDKPAPLVFKDMTSRSRTPWPHSFKSLKKLNFPVELMDQDVLSPISALLQRKELPVFAAQANFIDGGLLLFATVNHAVSDALGLFNEVSVWASKSKANWNVELEEDNGISIGPESLDRTPLMQGNADVQRNDVREFQLQAANAKTVDANDFLTDGKPTAVSQMQMSIFSIAKPKLEELRSTISESVGSWVTTNNALAIWIWTQVNRARFTIPSGISPSGNLVVAIDGRLHLDPALPSMYVGNASLAFPITLPIQEYSIASLAVSMEESMMGFTGKSTLR